MTSERSRAYGRFITSIDSLSASKLHADEQQLLRDAADALFFTPGTPDADAQYALSEAEGLFARLVEADRLIPETAERLLAALRECGDFALTASE